jgi:hypothetical protein
MLLVSVESTSPRLLTRLKHVPDSLFHGWGIPHAKAIEKTDATVHRTVIPPNTVLIRRWTAFGVKVLMNATMTSFDRHIDRMKRMVAAYSAY